MRGLFLCYCVSESLTRVEIEMAADRSTSPEELADAVANLPFHPEQLTASAILARLPVGFKPSNCLVVDESFSPMLYHAFASLLCDIPMFVVTQNSKDIVPAPGQTTIGFTHAPSVDSLYDSKELGVPKNFGLVILIVIDLKQALPYIKQTIDQYTEPSGLVIAAYRSGNECVKDLRMPGLRLVYPQRFANILYPCQPSIVLIENRRDKKIPLRSNK